MVGPYSRFQCYLTTLEMKACSEFFAADNAVFWPTPRRLARAAVLPEAVEARNLQNEQSMFNI